MLPRSVSRTTPWGSTPIEACCRETVISRNWKVFSDDRPSRVPSAGRRSIAPGMPPATMIRYMGNDVSVEGSVSS